MTWKSYRRQIAFLRVLYNSAFKKIVGELLDSLDHDKLEVDIDEQWASVIKRRSNEIEFGTVKSLTWSEVKAMTNARARKNA